MQWQHIPVVKAVAWIADADAAADATRAGRGLLEISSGAPDVSYVEPMTRRRLSPLARAVLHCAGRCQTAAGDIRIVAASRHGEVGRTLEQLEDIASGNELSPTAFSLSVHNATAGILSIVRRNRAPVNAVAAGEETFAWGLLDAYATLVSAPEQPVLFLYGDDRLPDALSEFEPAPDGLHAIGLMLGRDARHSLRIRTSASAGGATRRSLPGTFMASPSGGRWAGQRAMQWEWHWVDHRDTAAHAH
jgi:hypothetical protein